jgi:hypothetical protein
VTDSSILPLSLYFEPEEITAACIAIGYYAFLNSYPKFIKNRSFNHTNDINIESHCLKSGA